MTVEDFVRKYIVAAEGKPAVKGYLAQHQFFDQVCALTFSSSPLAHSATFEFSLLAHLLQMLLDSKINSHISYNFCPDLQDGRWILKALNAN